MILLFIQANFIIRPSHHAMDGDSKAVVGDADMGSRANPASGSRQRTPVPDGPLVPPDDPDSEMWNVSSSDVVPVDDDWRTGSPGMSPSNSLLYPLMSMVETPTCFPVDPLWKGIHGKHIHVASGPTFGGGNHIGYTKTPLKFNNRLHPSQVFMYWTDNKGKWQHGPLNFKDLMPACPLKKHGLIMVLNGDLKGQVLKVDKVLKAEKSVLLITPSGCQKELVENVCVVEDHLP
jgi:hypothetical protein